MKVHVQYTAQLRAARGLADEQIECSEGASVAELLVDLAARGGPETSRHVLNGDGGTNPSLLVVVNGVAVSPGDRTATVLKAGDTVALLPPIAGG